MAKEPDAPKRVPSRNNLTEKPVLYKQSKANQLQGRDQEFHYEFLPTDPRHPQWVENKLRRHEYGYAATGYVEVEPWEVVHSETDPAVRQELAREDQGKPIDTKIWRGTQILCRIPKSEHAKYGIADAAYQAKRKAAITAVPQGMGAKIVEGEGTALPEFTLPNY